MDETSGSKFNHSVRVPRMYKDAASVLQKYLNKEGRVKSLAYNGNYRDARRIYAMVTNVITNYQNIYKILQYQGVFSDHSKMNPCVAVILASEIIRNGGVLKGESRPILTMNLYAEKLLTEFETCSKENASIKVVDSLPRYVRVNTLKKSVEDVSKDLTTEGWTHIPYGEEITYDDYLNMVNNIEEYTYLTDFHIKSLFVFPPGTSFYGSKLLNSSEIILQDKASCLPVFLCGVSKKAKVIDACAAPGNKTSYVAALVGKKGSLVAIEKDPKRCDLMRNLLEQKSVQSVRVINADFTQIDPSEYKSCDLILVDPTCSASGMGGHFDPIGRDRVHRLSGFQYEVLSHALSFPGVKSVVYSTCSIYEKENEQIIEDVLKKYRSDFTIVSLKDFLPGWKHFGSAQYSFGLNCIKTKTEIDRCQGFFVAKFERVENEASYDECEPKNTEKVGENDSSLRSNGREAAEDEEFVSEEVSISIRKKKKKRKDFDDCLSDTESIKIKKKKYREVCGKDDSLGLNGKEDADDEFISEEVLISTRKKKKKRKDVDDCPSDTDSIKKMKKSKKIEKEDKTVLEQSCDAEEIGVLSVKKKKKECVDEVDIADNSKKHKKRRRNKEEISDLDDNCNTLVEPESFQLDDNSSSKKKKKKKRRDSVELEDNETNESRKKHKRKKENHENSDDLDSNYENLNIKSKKKKKSKYVEK